MPLSQLHQKNMAGDYEQTSNYIWPYRTLELLDNNENKSKMYG